MNRRKFLGLAAPAGAASTLTARLLAQHGAARGDAVSDAATFAPWKDEIGVQRFRKDFWWGASTSAYQVEGAWNEDGKGESVWDHFAHTPSMIKGASTGDIGCDTYHRFREDMVLMRQLHLRSYRFSISWPRVRSTGSGAWNEKGLDYYDRLTDAILKESIRPVCTLFHWDLPQTLASTAWRSRTTVDLFAEYAAKIGSGLTRTVNGSGWCTSSAPRFAVW